MWLIWQRLIMNSIKKFFFDWRSTQLLRKFRAPRQTLNYKEAKSVGILFITHNDNMHQAVNHFIKMLKQEGKKYTALTFFDRQSDNPYTFKYDFFTEKDIDFFGNIKSEPVTEFINTDFDYLYCLCTEPTDVFDPILASCKAKCRVGFFRENKVGLFEMMIQLKPEESVDKLIDQMVHYTKAIEHN